MRYTAFVITLFIAGIAASTAAEKIAQPDTITLTEYNRTAGTVTFTHKDHGATGSQKPSCAFCHHTTAWDQTPGKCSVCHKAAEESGVPADIVAFHKLCIACHKDEIEKGDNRVSLSCDSCHTPEK